MPGRLSRACDDKLPWLRSADRRLGRDHVVVFVGTRPSCSTPTAGGCEASCATRGQANFARFDEMAIFPEANLPGYPAWQRMASARQPGRRPFHSRLCAALRTQLEGDSYLRQAGAAMALAKAARYFGDEQAAALARQAMLTLLEDTALENPKNATVRVCTLPAAMANSLGASAALVQAIYELPAPADDLIDQAGQLCNGIRKSQRADGSLACGETAQDNEAIDFYTGEALLALMRSHQHRPEAWKLEIVQKALPFYQVRWRAGKHPGAVPGHTVAFAEAFLQSKDRAFADFVFEMNDWLCTLQYQQVDSQHPLWVGGFMGCVDGKPVPAPPQALAAISAQSLVEAARVARQIGDVQRWDRYKAALERCLQFLTTLQYMEANSQHFAEWYRPAILGALHASHTDGNIRLDYTSTAVCAMVGYLKYVAEVP